jgi:EAL and modified HD-GYP domain-containing signal transduction protein
VYGHPGDPSVRFLIGLLSCIDVLMGQPMLEVLDRLPVGEEVREALLEGTGPHAAILRLTSAYEDGAWDDIDAEFTSTAGGRPELATLYGDAVQWAGERLRSARIK